MIMCFHNRRRVGVLLYLVLIIILLVLAVMTDLQCCESGLLKYLFGYVNVLSRKSLDDLQDMMEIIWGIAITITIFMLEISNQYRYGISLKTVVNYSLMRGTVFLGMAGYLMLYPLMYVAVKLSMKCTALWCAGAAIATFGSALAFILLIFRKRSVRKLLVSLTIAKIRKLDKSADKEILNLHSQIDSLPVTDFMIHINYDNAEETRCLVEVLSTVFCSIRAKKDDNDRSMIDMTLLTAWSTHIIYKSGTATEEEQSRTTRLLVELWRKLPEDNKIAYTVQMLIPFVEMKDNAGVEIMCRFLRIIRQDEPVIMLYLLLYTEYRYWFVYDRILEWFYIGERYLRKWIESILTGKEKPDRELAWCFWKSWRFYNMYDGQFGFDHFYAFCQDAEHAIGKEKEYEPNSVILKKILEEQVYEAFRLDGFILSGSLHQVGRRTVY